MRQVLKIFLQGLVATVPLVLTAWMLYWTLAITEDYLGDLILNLLPMEFYVPGMGIVCALILIFAAGVLTHAWMIRKVIEWGERLIGRVPLVKTVYHSVRDFLEFLARMSDRKKLNKVVAVDLDSGIRVIGFVTRDKPSSLPEPLGGKGCIAVYLPLSYQIGGYTVVVPQSRVKPLDLSVEEAMRFAVTAGMTKQTPRIRDAEPESSPERERKADVESVT